MLRGFSLILNCLVTGAAVACTDENNKIEVGKNLDLSDKVTDTNTLFVRPGDDAKPRSDYPIAGPKSQWVHVGRGGIAKDTSLIWVAHPPPAFIADLLSPSEMERCLEAFEEDETVSGCSVLLGDHIFVDVRRSGNVEMTFFTESLRKKLADQPVEFTHFTERAMEARRAQKKLETPP
jgi:hypothetical protein